MQLSDFHYHLPEELIAQSPLPERDGARMLVVDRASGTWEDRRFADLPSYLGPGDCLVLNNSRVIPSRLLGRRPGHTGRIEVFLVRPVDDSARRWYALVRPGRKLPVGETVEFTPEFSARVIERADHGERVLELAAPGDPWAAIEAAGHVPLPPYIRREDAAADVERYQTVFARERGSVAAPTAGLHFTPRILEQIEAHGVETAPVTLHVGLGTFQPLREDQVEANRLHAERYAIPPESARRIAAARRVVAAGTTSVRTVETWHATGALSGETGIFLYPGRPPVRVGALVTNFHLPQSSLLLLVAALAGTELTLAAYRHAVAERYRFFSYGDCMLVL